ncbi:MAG: hypothetical protein ACAH80_11520 [Alphaproteobacteria bacterium]
MQRRVIRKLRSEFPTEWRGDYSGQMKPATEVAKNQTDFKKMWAKAHGRRYPVPPAPELPRGKMAIGIFAGESDSRADISVTSCTEDQRRLTVSWQAAAAPPAEHAPLSGKYEQYLLKIVDRTDKKVTFTKAPTAPVIP